MKRRGIDRRLPARGTVRCLGDHGHGVKFTGIYTTNQDERFPGKPFKIENPG